MKSNFGFSRAQMIGWCHSLVNYFRIFDPKKKMQRRYPEEQLKEKPPEDSNRKSETDSYNPKKSKAPGKLFSSL